MGPCKVRNETETKRNETKQIETKRNKTENETDRNETKQIETKRNETKRNETNRNETKRTVWNAKLTYTQIIRELFNWLETSLIQSESSLNQLMGIFLNWRTLSIELESAFINWQRGDRDMMNVV